MIVIEKKSIVPNTNQLRRSSSSQIVRRVQCFCLQSKLEIKKIIKLNINDIQFGGLLATRAPERPIHGQTLGTEYRNKIARSFDIISFLIGNFLTSIGCVQMECVRTTLQPLKGEVHAHR